MGKKEVGMGRMRVGGKGEKERARLGRAASPSGLVGAS